jgi:serine/threonine protein kinase
MIGRTVSHYRILEKLGEGGMGEVYKAEDIKLKRTVALKFLPPELTRDGEARERFIQEAQAASALDHPNICTIHEIDQTAEGQIFMVMACYEGETLEERIRNRGIQVDEAMNIACQIARGLAKAHGRGIVHRDIKSANVMLTSEGTAKILDFGLAKLAGQTGITRTGSTLGTAACMSPEQAGGKEIDHRTDLWSLGVVLHEMLAGQMPFQGEYEQAVVYAILNEKPPKIRSMRPEVPPELEKIVDRCLEKNPDQRYQRAEEIIADLRTVQQTSVGTMQLNKRRPRRIPWIGIGAALLAALILAYFFLTRGKATVGDKSIAVLPFVDMSPQKDQEYFCDGMTEELINRLSNIQSLRVPARTSAFYFKRKTVDIGEVGRKLNVQTVLEGSVQKAGDRLRITAQLINVANGYHLWSEKYDRKLEDVFAIQDEISSAIVDSLQLKLTPREAEKISEHPINNVKAYECYLKAWRLIYRFDEKSLESAFTYLQSALDIMGENAELFAGLSLAYLQRANIGIGQEEDLKRSEEYARRALALKPDLPSALVHLGNLAIYKDYPENLHDEFHSHQKVLLTNPFDAEALRNMAVNCMLVGKPSQALIFADLYEQHDPLNPWRYAVKGLYYQYDCRFGSAVEQLRMFYQADPTSPIGQSLYSWALASIGKQTEALAVIDLTDSGHAQNTQIAFSRLMKCAFQKDKEGAARIMTLEFQKTCRRDFEWSYHIASRLSLLGTREEALDWLENAVNRGFINYPFLQCDPFLDNIRGEERFKKLMEHAKYEWEHFEVPE